MPKMIEKCWVFEPFDLTDLADQLAKIVNEETTKAYNEGLKDSNGKGMAREARAFQSFNSAKFLGRWFNG